MHVLAPRSSSVFLSLLLHVMVLMWLRSARLVRVDLPLPQLLPVKVLAPPPPPVQKVPPRSEIVPEPAPLEPPAAPAPPEPPAAEIPLPEQQIVSPPDGGVNQPPLETRFLSERDVTVEEQMVRRGAPAPGTDEPPEPEAPREAERPKPDTGEASSADSRLASLPRLEQLLPNALRLADEGYDRSTEAAKEAEERKRERFRSGDVWFPTSEPFGTFDFLPDVREGDITLLNTKAEIFAPFVRRVALRVFQNLMISLRHELSYAGLSSRESVTAEAVMDRQGEMVSLTVTERSASIALGTDRKLQQACADGFFDRNPPPGAEGADGNIHFLLRTFVVTISDHRGLRFGYRVTFQAGLL